MKKLFLLAITVGITVFAMGQEASVKQLRSLFSNPSKQQIHQNQLKSATGTTKMRLDSIVAEHSMKEIFTYDQNGNCTLNVYNYWNSSKAVWETDMKWEDAYDIHGNKTSEIFYELNSQTVLMPRSKIECAYNENGNVTLAVEYSWNSSTASWYVSFNYKYEYAFDNRGNNTLIESFSRTNSTSSWEEKEKTEKVYDNNNNITIEVYYDWSNPEWMPRYKHEYTYSNNNCISWVTYEWSNSQWNPYDSKYEYTYDTSYSVDDLIMPNIRFGIRNMLTTESDYSYKDSSWVLDGKKVFYYSPQIVSSATLLTEKNTLKATIQNGQLQVSGIEKSETLSVFNLQGKAIYCQKALDTTICINLPNNGLYIVRCGSQSIKVVK